MYENKNNEELLIMLAEVCEELRTRAIGVVETDIGVQPILSINGNMFTGVQLSTHLGVKTFMGLKQDYKINIFQEGKTLQDMLNDQKNAVIGMLHG